MKGSFIILMLLIIFSSCRSKQKAVHRENEKILIKQIDQLKQTIAENFKSDSVSKSGSSSLKVTEGIDIELLQADSSKTITITMPDGKQTKIKGANVKLIKQKETTQTTDTTVVQHKKENTKTDISESQSNKNTQTDKSYRTTNTDIKTTSTWLQIGMLLSVIIFIVVWLYNRLKP